IIVLIDRQGIRRILILKDIMPKEDCRDILVDNDVILFLDYQCVYNDWDAGTVLPSHPIRLIVTEDASG
ncbi:MAG: hypothetical protein IJ119_15730, partial [Clostridia bacterium]|nr:hypothetical protein [Clostridia bacterium]